MAFWQKKCILCEAKHAVWRPYCQDCKRLFALVQANLGTMGLSQLMDTLIATGVPKPRIYKFLNADPRHKGSMMDQITAQLTNNLAEGIGVKGRDMTPIDVKTIRSNPKSGVSTKPIDG